MSAMLDPDFVGRDCIAANVCLQALPGLMAHDVILRIFARNPEAADTSSDKFQTGIVEFRQTR